MQQNLNSLFARLRSGDRAAFGEIYTQLKRPVYTIAYRLVQQPQSAEDITHDVFLKLYLSPPEAQVRNPRAWVFQMAHNLAIDALRKQKYREAAPEPGAFYDSTDLRLDLEAAFRILTDQEKVIVTLKLNAGLTFGEIAKITGLSPAATYRSYRKALNTMKTYLNGGAI